MTENKEIRQLQIEYRTTDDSRKIEGVAIVFNQLSEDLGGFREMIKPEAVEGVIENSDIFFLYNHNQDRGFLARSRYGKGSLTTQVMEDGVHFSFDAPKTALGDEMLEHLKRGDINQCSFAFMIDKDEWERQADNTYIRTITKFDRLFDMSIVDNPAYSQTSVCKRFAEVQEEDKKKLEEIRKQDIANYYSQLREENKKYLTE